MTRKIALLAAALTVGLSATAAAPVAHSDPSIATPDFTGPPGDTTGLGELVYLAAQTVAERAGGLRKDQPILVSTIVMLDDLQSSSTFGRLASQLITNRLGQRGYSVKDINYTGAVLVREGTGEIVLTRDVARISRSLNAQAVVAGTYAVAGRQIFLNIRMLNAETGEIMSSADVVVPLNHNTEALIASVNGRQAVLQSGLQ